MAYEYGIYTGDQTIPNKTEYPSPCFKVSLSKDGFLFFKKVYYKIYVSLAFLLAHAHCAAMLLFAPLR